MDNSSEIVLRTPVMSDAEVTWQWRNQSAIRDNFSAHSFVVSLEDEQRWLQHQLSVATDSRCYAVVHRITGELIGMTFLKHINKNNCQAEFAIMMDEAWAGKGFGTLACRETLKDGFSGLNLHRIFLKVRVDNLPAIRIYEKCGFKKEGILRDDFFKHGKFIDQFIMAILATEFNTSV
ncbi:MAG: Spermidine N(1)-acetyltransferase [Bacteroidota bacterium]|jgi:RimJ/RimL family protein N-acetyltransferase